MLCSPLPLVAMWSGASGRRQTGLSCPGANQVDWHARSSSLQTYANLLLIKATCSTQVGSGSPRFRMLMVTFRLQLLNRRLHVPPCLLHSVLGLGLRSSLSRNDKEQRDVALSFPAYRPMVSSSESACQHLTVDGQPQFIAETRQLLDDHLLVRPRVMLRFA